MADSLQQFLDQFPDPIRALRSVPDSPFAPLNDDFKMEYTNWRSEQEAWDKSVALFDLSHHMIELYIEGPEALKMLQYLAINKLDPFTSGTAKQMITVSQEGYLIGDGILQRHDEEKFMLIGDIGLTSWARYQIDVGDWNLTLRTEGFEERAERGAPVLYRYQVQGPNALKLMENALGGPVPEVKFFHMADFEIAGLHVKALRHGMAGQPGFELTGPWAEHQQIRAALLEAGKDLGVVEVGWLAYFSCCIESGWLPNEMPATYYGESTRGFREWFPSEPTSLGGSYDSLDLVDYMLTPKDLGYDKFIDFDHDFIGKEALQSQANLPARWRKVVIEWDSDDVGAAVADMLKRESGPPPQYMKFNDISCALTQYDAVQHDGRTVGFLVEAAYVAPHRKIISIGVVEPEFAEVGTELTVLWGDSLEVPRSDVEEHRQVSIGATVAPLPYTKYAREQYRVNA